MNNFRCCTGLLLALVILAVTPRYSFAQAQTSSPSGTTTVVAQASDAEPPKKHHSVPLSDAWLAKFGLGCIGAAGVALAATYAAGPTEAMMLFGGGLLTASNTTILNLALLGQIGAPSCVMGATMAPTALWVYGSWDQIWGTIRQKFVSAGSAVEAKMGLGNSIVE